MAEIDADMYGIALLQCRQAIAPLRAEIHRLMDAEMEDAKTRFDVSRSYGDGIVALEKKIGEHLRFYSHEAATRKIGDHYVVENVNNDFLRRFERTVMMR